MAAVPQEDQVRGASDAELIDAVRGGDGEAFGLLYERHVGAAHAMARQVTKSQAEADDVVSEAFAKVLGLLRDGRGPTDAFRAYLLTAVRHGAYDRANKAKRTQTVDDVETVPNIDISQPFRDPAVENEERSLIAEAFNRLPERWQMVLWHVEIEGESPSKVAPMLGMTANGVSALAYRAREGLKQQYLQVHLMKMAAEPDACRSAIDRLGAWTREGLSKRETAQVNAHLDDCDRCSAVAAELMEINGSLKVFVAPIVLGGTATASGYLAASGGGLVGAGVIGAVRSNPRKSLAAGGAVLAALAALGIALAANETDPPPLAAAPVSPETPEQQQVPAARTPPPAVVPPVAPPPAPPAPPEPGPDPVPEPPVDEDGPLPPLPLIPPGTQHVADARAELNLPVLNRVHAALDVDRDQIRLDVEVGAGRPR
ncbi:sigma-70 family RNA polymerase sigma factor [Saccharopolyspora hirsuta]|uniref:Sigma-70 family RNA polymerase sigma factor n=1 Tax=Saccharopolyspora hirsuta TaxID=1837 RepID=A0A5M7BR38_SACHI|nr:sigma-70 family RNA polymerase sigma factor [Saccharopolyspora hirsuta]KAA5830667.1 sigma-70 family RNA polymerase sigma factor [Saccharopolyspora hirsuta]